MNCSRNNNLRSRPKKASAIASTAPSKQLFQQKPRATSGNAKPTASTATNILKLTAGYTSTAKASSLTGTRNPSHAKMRLNKPATRSRSPSRKTHSLLPAADSTSTPTESVSRTSPTADMPLSVNSKNRIDQVNRMKTDEQAYCAIDTRALLSARPFLWAAICRGGRDRRGASDGLHGRTFDLVVAGQELSQRSSVR